MKRFLTATALVGAAFSSSAMATVMVGVDDSTANWLGFMNVSELPANGGAPVFGSGWGVPDLVATFDDGAGTLTLSPNTIGDPNEFWYQPGRPGDDPLDPNDNGGPGALGNKIMEANLFQEFANGSPELLALQADGSLNFSGEVISNSFTSAHDSVVFIKEFTPDFSTSVETTVAVTPGSFDITHALTGLGGAVQYGFRTTGENVWVTDTAPFGNAVIAVPEPASLALIGLGGLAMLGRRRGA